MVPGILSIVVAIAMFWVKPADPTIARWVGIAQGQGFLAGLIMIRFAKPSQNINDGNDIGGSGGIL